ncbi:glycosyltransferase involved in cell wall biosynthesis [Actinoplanes octamycinicus]|uniref:Glycosyltransferase involved in cell wall biosynthesis n=1 Tax=Actinoplanes octamycinicus TaxID=135948 RepID=A0A7W7GZR4_9ACTN|nr:glycosyltransferase [Actinoplanes octamycinicus]MBB4741335.1 glycosyltransferase involved in cell wall biosynthesis [Actinoplanes octamycinicus]GIE62865.1 glycosyl transferase [Actinoplanes octamycinicus]
MRIAMISEHASPLAALGGVDAGGQNTHVAELAAALAADGHELRVYTRRDNPDLPAVVPMHERIDVVHVPAGPASTLPKDELLPHMGTFAEWMAADWDDFAPDVAHAHFWMSGLAAVTAARRRRVPVVHTYHALGTVKRRHQGAADTSPAHRIGYERELGRVVDRVIVQCQDELRELVRLGVPRSRTTLVPSGVNVERFRKEGPVAERSDRPRILTVGRLVPRKGFEELIAALPEVPRAELVIAGGPEPAELATDEYAQHLLQLAKDSRVDDRVRLLGAVPAHRMPEWYRSADVLAATPWYEPFGLTPLEAMACGVPVVATAVGGLTDTVVDGVTGDLVAPRDPHGLGQTLRKLLTDQHRRLGYAAAAVDRAVHAYAWPQIAARMSAVYASVASIPAVVA